MQSKLNSIFLLQSFDKFDPSETFPLNQAIVSRGKRARNELCVCSRQSCLKAIVNNRTSEVLLDSKKTSIAK